MPPNVIAHIRRGGRIGRHAPEGAAASAADVGPLDGAAARENGLRRRCEPLVDLLARPGLLEELLPATSALDGVVGKARTLEARQSRPDLKSKAR